MEWVILDNIKYRKVVLKQLKRVFKITNIQVTSSIPGYIIISEWIYELFVYFESIIIYKIANVRSKISITFNDWGLKYEKLLVIRIVIHFINEYYENVICLISLPELPGHGKAGVGT